MFAIYNINGRAFRDSLENLKKVRKPDTAFETELQQNVAADETIVIQGHDNEVPISNQKSINAYRKLLHANEKTVIVHAYQLMTHPVKTIMSNLSLTQAYEDFQAENLNQFPVLSPERQLIGMVTRQQVTEAYFERPAQTVADLISGDLLTADPISDIRRVAKVMVEYRLSAIPITDEADHLVGIISKTDIVKALTTEPPLSLWA